LSAGHAGFPGETVARIRRPVAGETLGQRFVSRNIGRELGLER
jgi:hypothetical protein